MSKVLNLKQYKILLKRKMFQINKNQQVNDSESPNIKELVQDLKSFKNLKPTTQKTSGNSYRNNDIEELIKHIKNKQHQMHLIKQSEEQFSPNNLKSDQSSMSEKYILEKPKSSKLPARYSGGAKVRKKKQWHELKNVITNERIKNLKNTFIQKIKRNNIYSEPVQNKFQDETNTPNIFDSKGIQLKEWIERLFDLVMIINVITTLFTASLQLVFQVEELGQNIRYSKVVGLTVFLIQIISNLTIVKFSLGRKLSTVRQISSSYLDQNLYIDVLNFFIMLLQVSSQAPFTKYLRLFTFCRMPNLFKRIEKLEVYFIQNYYKEQYWTLVKVFLFNFLYAHFLSIALIGMSQVNQNDNWIVAKGLQNSSWFERYIWSYYWSTTIMLTIGFGDIVPACYQQAIVMIFLETLSCIILAYNINCVGTLISNIRYQDMQKSKNLKMFKKLTDKNNISGQLCWKVNNFIQQHSNMKKMFNIQEQSSFVEKLPIAYKIEYLKQVNKTVFKSLFYFNNIMNKTLFDLAQKLEKKIAHPEEILLNSENSFDLLILKNGEIGCQVNKGDRVFSQLITNKVKVLQNQPCFMLHANFFTKIQLNFKIKSLVYSIFYSLPYEKLIQSLKDYSYDYQFFCQLRDGSKYVIDEFQTFKCQYCKSNHTQFSCPKLHYIPIKQHIIDKQLYRQKKIKNIRLVKFERDRYSKQSALMSFLSNQSRNLQTQQYLHNKKLEMIFKIKEKYPVEQKISNTSQVLLSTQKEMNIQQSHKHISGFDYAAEQIKSYVAKIIGGQNGEDLMWTVGLDQAKNYKGYFKKGNPDNVGDRFKKNKCKKITDMFNQSGILTSCRSARIPLNKRGSNNIGIETPFDTIQESNKWNESGKHNYSSFR